MKEGELVIVELVTSLRKLAFLRAQKRKSIFPAYLHEHPRIHSIYGI